MLDRTLVDQFWEVGACVVPSVIDMQTLKTLKSELIAAIDDDLQNQSDVFDAGMVHNCMLRGRGMLQLLDNPMFNEWTTHLLSPHCIVYAYQSSSLPPGGRNYGTRIHVDCPRFIPDYMTNLGVIFPLDDFSEQNGATYYLPGSHGLAALPQEDEFYSGAHRILAKAGDMILFHGRLVHSAGVNHTDAARHSLTINLCRHYMKQRFDFPRMVSDKELALVGEHGKRLIGMNARVPASLAEFYLPVEQRLYKPGQD